MGRIVSTIVSRIVSTIVTISFSFKVDRDGNCMVNAIYQQLSLKTQEVLDRYGICYMRRQVVDHAIQNITELRPFLEKNIRELYGAGDGELGPFSIASYFEYILKDKSWGDTIFLSLVCSMWGLRLTVVCSDNLMEIKYRHNGELKDVCVGLLYNGEEDKGGHYSPLFRIDGQFLDSTELFLSDDYFDIDIDREEREFRGEGIEASGDNILISRSRLIELVIKEKQLDEINAVVRGQTIPGRGGARVGGRSRAAMETRLRSDTEEEMVVGEIPEVHEGDTFCDLCKVDSANTKKFKEHVIKFHEGKFRFLCEECNKGFMSKGGFKLHEKSHTTGYTKCPENNCKGGWSSVKAKKKGTIRYFIQVKQENSIVSSAHNTSLLKQFGT